MASQAPIANFKPLHERIVLMHIGGMKNVEIAEALDLTPVRVSQVLNDPSALELIDELRGRVRENIMTEIGDRILLGAQKSVDNILKTVDADIPVSSKIKEHQDRVGFKLLDIIGYGPKRESAPQGSGGISLSPENEERLVKAIERSNQVQAIPEAEVLDAGA